MKAEEEEAAASKRNAESLQGSLSSALDTKGATYDNTHPRDGGRSTRGDSSETPHSNSSVASFVSLLLLLLLLVHGRTTPRLLVPTPTTAVAYLNIRRSPSRWNPLSVCGGWMKFSYTLLLPCLRCISLINVLCQESIQEEELP